jgi:hypothetical protein
MTDILICLDDNGKSDGPVFDGPAPDVLTR